MGGSNPEVRSSILTEHEKELTQLKLQNKQTEYEITKVKKDTYLYITLYICRALVVTIAIICTTLLIGELL